MKKISTSIFLMLLFVLTLNAQVSQEWVNRYSGPISNYNSPSLITNDESGNIYVTGSSAGNNSGLDIVTIKYSSSGSMLWTARYNGYANLDDEAASIVIDQSGNAYVAGTASNAGTMKDIITIKYNPIGQQIWAVSYNGTLNQDDAANAMIIDNAGNIYVTGYTTGTSSQDFVTIKYSPDGALQLVKIYNGPGNTYDEAFNITADGDNVCVCGLSRSIYTKRDYATIKYSSAGNELWVARYDGPSHGYDMAYAVTADNIGNVYVTGTSWDWYYGYDYLTVKYNSEGVEQWNARYEGGGTGSDIAKSIRVDMSGNIYVTGEVWTSAYNKDYGTIKYDQDGNTLWIRVYDGPGNSNDIANSMAMDNSGNIYVTGWSRNTSNFGTEDFCTVKYNSNGLQKWVMRYNGAGNNEDISNAIAVDVSGNVFVTGRSKLSSNNYEISTIKYSQPIGIDPISNNIPNKFELFQNYPNPFNPSTKINFNIPKSTFVNLIVYDALGRKLADLINEELQAGQYSYELDAANFPSGVYFYKLISYRSDDLERSYGYTDTKKMIIIK
ncbi:MAG TPA: SBBP repeat-containing protein [Ignavibacteria bacterium]|jgi:uncharacterized delta-60 repeat protein